MDGSAAERTSHILKDSAIPGTTANMVWTEVILQVATLVWEAYALQERTAPGATTYLFYAQLEHTRYVLVRT